MTRKILVLDGVLKKVVFTFTFAMAVMTLATAFAPQARGCVACAQRDDGTYYCNTITGDGSDVCVIKATSCDTYYSCVCTSHCSGCPPEGCPANPARLDDPLASPTRRLQACSYYAGRSVRLIRAAGKTMTNEEKLSDFLRRVDAGEFTDAVVYMHTDGPISIALMRKVTTNRWKTFKFGFETNPKTGAQQKTYDIETKTGNKVHIVLMD